MLTYNKCPYFGKLLTVVSYCICQQLKLTGYETSYKNSSEHFCLSCNRHQRLPIFSTWKWYYFTTKNGEFYFDMFEAKGRDFAMMNRWWDDYKTKHNTTDTTIYRTFAMNPFAFWEWQQYLFSDKYCYPYISPKDIEKGELKEYLLTKQVSSAQKP